MTTVASSRPPMSEDEWHSLVAAVDSLVQEFEQLPLPAVQGKVFELLNGIDALHREALHRLAGHLSAEQTREALGDPTVHTLFELYDLLPGGSGDETTRPRSHPKLRVIEASTPPPPPRPQPSRFPRWVPVRGVDLELLREGPKMVTVDDRAALVCSVDDQVFALAARCGHDGASLAGATLSGYTLTCPSHEGCHYDVRQGTQLAGTASLDCYSVRVSDDGVISIGLDMTFQPDLPAF